MFDLISGEKVLVVWSGNNDPEKLKTRVENIKEIVGYNGVVAVENSEMLLSSSHSESSFNVAVFDEYSFMLTEETILSLLAEILRVLKPCGKLFIRSNSSVDSLLSNLKLAGFTNINESLNYAENVSEIKAQKPDFEVGSTVKLNFNRNVVSGGIGSFKLDLEDPDVQLDDPDDLLSEEDLLRPDPSSLKVCGTTGKRKACKDCVCGLKEELDAESEAKLKANQDFKPSCGSCYLGDAFRCASCPYLGMPAFKPGEKVKLTEDTLQDDI